RGGQLRSESRHSLLEPSGSVVFSLTFQQLASQHATFSAYRLLNVRAPSSQLNVFRLCFPQTLTHAGRLLFLHACRLTAFAHLPLLLNAVPRRVGTRAAIAAPSCLLVRQGLLFPLPSLR